MHPSSDSRVIDLTIRIGFLALFVYGTLMLVAPLFGLVLWAVILCVAVHPMHKTLSRWLGGREKISATLLTLAGLAIALGPVALMAGGMVELAGVLQERAAAGTLHLPPLGEKIGTWPVVGPPFKAFWGSLHGNIQSFVSQHGEELLSAGATVLVKVASVGLGFLTLLLSLLIMGGLLVTGPQMVDYTRRFAERVFKGSGGALVDMAGTTVRNVSRGVIGVAVVQSLMAGIIMWIFGIQVAGVLALIALLLCVVQVGPAPVLVPVIVWAWMSMETGKALLLTVLLVPVMLIDNVLKPLWMSRGLDTPMLVILIGVLGGLMAYGLVGIFIGPVILSVFHKLFTYWIDHQPDDGEAGVSGDS